MSKDVWTIVSIVIVAALSALSVAAISWGIDNHEIGFGFWIGSLLTMGIMSYLYADNPFYKFTEHLFVGVSASYWIATYYWTQIDTNLLGRLFPEKTSFLGMTIDFSRHGHEQNLWYLIPLVLGLFMLARLIPSIGWISRWSLSFVVGLYAGLRSYGYLQSNVMQQAKETFRPIIIPGDFWAGFNHLVLVVGVVSALLYFFFSKEHKGMFGTISRVGIFFLMVSFGAAFGFAVMGRISLLIGRFDFLIRASTAENGYPSIVVTVLMVAILSILAMKNKGKGEDEDELFEP